MGNWLWWLLVSPFWIYFEFLSAFSANKASDLYLTTNNQKKFDTICDQIRLLIEEDTNYLDLVSQIIFMGQTFAKEIGFQDPNQFIFERRGESVKIGLKEALDSCFKEKLDLLVKSQHPLTTINGLSFPDGKFYKISSKNTLFPELDLVSIVHVPQAIPNSEGLVKSFFGDGSENTTLFFSPAKDLNRMQNYLFCKWEELVDQPVSEHFMSDLAVFHWYFIQVHPFTQGSEFVAKVLVASLLKTKGINWKIREDRGMLFEILLEPYLDEFVRKYQTYFYQEI